MKRLFLLNLFCLLLSTFSLDDSLAGVAFEDAIFPEFATSGRALAMGNAFICKVDDASAVFYNPAGLGTVRHSHIHLSNFHLETNKGWIEMGTGGKAANAFGNFSKGFNLEGIRTLALENKGKLSHSRFHMLPNFTTRFFTLGYLLLRQTRATIGQTSGANFEYADRLDHGPYAGMNLSLFGGVLKFGASFLFLNRKEIIGEQAQDETFDVDDGSYKKGTGVITTGGARLILPIAWLPTFSATMHNALDQHFSGRAAGSPTKVKKTLDVGFSLSPRLGQTTKFHIEVNYKDLQKEYPDISSARRLLVGGEFIFARVMRLRLGYGDGFGSFGLGIKSRKLQFDLATYAVDTTSTGFRGLEDRRFSMSISSGF